MLVLKIRDAGAKPEHSEGHIAIDGQKPRIAAEAQLLDRAEHLLKTAPDLPGHLDGGLGRQHFSTNAVEQAKPKFSLQCPDLKSDGPGAYI